MKIEWRGIDAIRESDRNPRRIPKSVVSAVAKSIQRFGRNQIYFSALLRRQGCDLEKIVQIIEAQMGFPKNWTALNS